MHLTKLLSITLIYLFSFQFLVAQESTSEPPKAGTLYLSNNQMSAQVAISLKTDVKMQISGLSARVTVTQTFENTTDQWVEGKYMFPLPEKAAVDHLTMKIGERLIIGEIKEKQEAKKIYEQAKISGRKASLVEQHRANMFTNSVANIAPYEKIEIIIEYQQDVIYQKEQGFSIRFPMTITPRYHPTAIYQESYEQNPNSTSNKSKLTRFFNQTSGVERYFTTESDDSESNNINRATVNIELDAGFALLDLKSVSHKLNTQQKTESEYQISFAEEVVKADRDFILSWMPVPSVQPRAAIFSEEKNLENGDKENYLSLMVLPPSTSKIAGSNKNAGAHDESDALINREIVFVIDTSGSMAGESMRQAKDSLAFALTTLQKGDKFNVIEFNSETSKLFSSAMDVNVSNINIAKLYVDQLEADGGTEMFAAIEASLDGREDHHLVRQVIFLTDGAIANEAELFSLIDELLGDSRLYTVGIGSAPNTFFMKRAAKFGRGTFTFIADSNESREKMSDLFTKISRPQLTHINIKWPYGLQADVWPKKIPDLYDGEPLWIKAKVASDSVSDIDGEIKLSGRVGDTLWQSTISADNSSQQSGVAVLWAREKIESIMNSAYHGQVDDLQKQEIINTALKHHIVSKFTSLVAVDKTPTRIAEELKQKMIKNHMPKGSKKLRQRSQSLNFPNTSLDLDISLRWFGVFFLLSLFGFIFLKVFR